jgi:hypothetical protein
MRDIRDKETNLLRSVVLQQIPRKVQVPSPLEILQEIRDREVVLLQLEDLQDMQIKGRMRLRSEIKREQVCKVLAALSLMRQELFWRMLQTRIASL